MPSALIPSDIVADHPMSCRSVSEMLAPLAELAAGSSDLVAQEDLEFVVQGGRCTLPRYLFLGAQAGEAPIHLGIFAGIHGDEPEGVNALIQFARLLVARPEIAGGYMISLYPVCNPTGFEAGRRTSRSGRDLNREFWSGSAEPEVRLLEQELRSREFQGIISLHADDTCNGFYGYARGALLTQHLIEPALASAERFLPRDTRGVIDGFAASNGVIRDCFEGVLSAPPDVSFRPFEIILETPQGPSAEAKEGAFVAALETILTEYRKFIAYAANL